MHHLDIIFNDKGEREYSEQQLLDFADRFAEQYANLRVIEELELIVKEINSFTATNRIEKRLLKTIKELKQ